MSDAIQITIHIVEYMSKRKKSIELITELEQMDTKMIPLIQVVYMYNRQEKEVINVVQNPPPSW